MSQPLASKAPTLGVSQNGEERSAQIDLIQSRLGRLRHISEQLAQEVAAAAAEIAVLAAPPAPPKSPDRN